MPSIWLSDQRPGSAHADDDEFDGNQGAGAPTGWTEVDHGTTMTVGEDVYGLWMETTAGTGVSGVYKALPAGDLTITTKGSLNAGVAAGTYQWGLGIWEDATSASGNVAWLGLREDSSNIRVRVYHQTDYNDAPTEVYNTVWSGFWPTYQYFRLRRNGTTWGFEISLDGNRFYRLALVTQATMGFTPTHVGPVMYSDSVTAIKTRWKFFRVVASDAGDAGRSNGDRFTITAATSSASSGRLPLLGVGS